MRYCRKLFATFMKKHVDTELVDLLQERFPASIFARYYNRPNYREELERVRSGTSRTEKAALNPLFFSLSFLKPAFSTLPLGRYTPQYEAGVID